MQKHEELLEMWEKDSKIDEVDLGRSSKNIPKLHGKYLTHLINNKTAKIALIHKLDQTKRDLDLYYSGKAEAHVYKEKPLNIVLKTKGAIEQHVNADPALLKIRAKLEYIDILIEALEYIMKQISQQNFIIKNMIEVERLRSGII